MRTVAPDRQVLARADSAFCAYENVTAATRAGAWFSFTIPQWATVASAIAGIPEGAWTRIEYPNAIYDEDTGERISDAEVAETPFTVFVSRRKDEHVTCRLVVRRVKRLGEHAEHGQQTLFDTWRYHAFITNSELSAVDADRLHRGHAIVEQVIAELKNGPLAHLPVRTLHREPRLAAVRLSRPQPRPRREHRVRARPSPDGHPAARDRRHSSEARHHGPASRHAPPRQLPWANAWTRLWDTATGPPRTGTS